MYQNKNSYKSKLDNSDVAWNESKLFYLFLNELDMDYKEAYYQDNWYLLYKVYKLKYIKVRPYIKKLIDNKQIAFFENDTEIQTLLKELKKGENDYSTIFNNNIYSKIVDIIENRMKYLDEKMAEAGLYLLIEKVKEWRPAALAGDDW